MKNLKDRLNDFRPPEDWQADHWADKIDSYDPDYERILFPWLETLSPDMIHHYVRNLDASQGMTDRYVAFWLIDQPHLDQATARLLFWMLLDQFPYHGSSADLEDSEHGVPRLVEALSRLSSRLAAGRFASQELAVTASELEDHVKRHEQNRVFALDRDWDPANAPFEVPAEWSTPIAGRPPAVPAKFPSPEDPLIATFLMSSNMPTRKDMFRMAEKYDVIEGKDRMILWAAYAACAVFVCFLTFKTAF